MRHVVLLLLLLSLPAHGGDTAVSKQCYARPIRIQLFGDSTQETAFFFVKREMARRFGPKVVVTSRAVSGTLSGQLLAGNDSKNLPWPGSVHADIVVINHGINDAWRGTLPAYREALAGLAAAPAIVVFQTPNPVHGQRFETDSFASAMRELARGPIADVHAYVSRKPDWQRNVPDGVHPDRVLLADIARNVTAPVLAPLVARLRCE